MVERVRIGEVLALDRVAVEPQTEREYVSIGVRSFGKGIFHYEPVTGDRLGKLRFFEVRADRLVISNIKGWEGAVAVSSAEDAGCVASNRFLQLVPLLDRIDVRWAEWLFLSEVGNELLQRASPGSADRNRTLSIERFEALQISLPPMVEQRSIANRLDNLRAAANELAHRSGRASELIRALTVSASTRPDLDEDTKAETGWCRVPLDDVLEPSTNHVIVEPTGRYLIAGTYSFGRGLIDRGSITGAETSYKTLTALNEGDVVVSKLNGWEGAVAVVGPRFDGHCVSSEFPTFKVDRRRLLPAFFSGIARSPVFWKALNSNARGSMVRRRRINSSEFLGTHVWLPPIEKQHEAAKAIECADAIGERRRRALALSSALTPSLLNQAFAGLS